jgi:uncharacterized phage protein (TIGR01671 family)
MYDVCSLEWSMGGLTWYGPGVGKGVIEVNKDFKNWSDKPWEVDSILMRGIGLNDKYGVEIYEGDILQFVQIDGNRLVRKSVHWCENSVRFELSSEIKAPIPHQYTEEAIYDKWAENTIIVGNVYENPELLKNTER